MTHFLFAPASGPLAIFPVSPIATWLPPSQIFRFLDVAAVIIAGIVGGIMARQRRFDIVGFVIVAIMTALGGGIVRDLLLNAKPVAIWDPAYLPAAISGAIIAYLSPLSSKWSNRAVIVLDAYVMGAWSGLGAVKALEFGTDIVPAILLGIITGIGGGIIRDACIGQVPSVFGGNYLYAVPSIVSAILATILGGLGHPSLALLVATLLGGTFVVVARYKRWQLSQSGGLVVTLNLRQLNNLVQRAERRGRRQEQRKLADLAQEITTEEPQEKSDDGSSQTNP